METTTYASRVQAIAVRKDACALAAEVMTGRTEDDLMPTLFSLTVFFEMYMTGGATRCREYGPRKAAGATLVQIAGGKSA
jgi:hypothetical protein